MRMACNRSSSGEAAPLCTKDAPGTRKDGFAWGGRGAAEGVSLTGAGAGGEATGGLTAKEAAGARKEARCTSGAACACTGTAAGLFAGTKMVLP